MVSLNGLNGLGFWGVGGMRSKSFGFRFWGLQLEGLKAVQHSGVLWCRVFGYRMSSA